MALILVVDDEPQIAAIAGDYLRRAGHSVAVAGDGAAALALAREQRPDLIVLDLGLPRVDGMHVARMLRRESDVPIIMLTARVDEADRLAGLDVGADDYLTKPFSPRELVARARAVLRRARGADGPTFRIADLVFDEGKRRVERDGAAVDLTATEFAIAAAMARRPGRVFTRAQLLDVIHGDRVEAFDRAVDAHVKNIRRKLERDPRRPQYIVTVYGIGYMFAEP
ncbi:MAG: response regulator [Vicinamibacterales bacterium]